MAIDSNTVLQEGMSALKAGDRARAREILMALVEQDETNEQAWIWLGGAMDDPEEQQTCLENALHINPNNAQAKQGLAWLRQKHPHLFAAPPPAAAPPPMPTPPPAATAYAPAAPAPAADPPLPEASAPPSAEEPKAPAIFIPIPTRPGEGPAGPPPCPWCGKPTQLTDTTCPSCKRTLMEKVEREKVKRVWSLLAGIVMLLSMLTLLGLGGYIVFAANAKGVEVKNTFKPQVEAAELQVKKEKDATKKEELKTKLMAAIDVQIEEKSNEIVQPVFDVGIPLMILGGLGLLLAFTLLRKSGFAYWTSWLYVLGALGYLLVLQPGANFSSLVESNELTPPPGAVLSAFSILPILLGAIFLFLGLAIPQYTATSRRFVGHDKADGDGQEHYNRGVVYRKRGFVYQAMVEWERAVQVSPQDAGFHHALGVAYAELNRRSDAIRELDEALSLDPTNEEIKQAHNQLQARRT